tara:strand:+ start:225 stop:1085 length:861 start_codon:yes stop_codon:yes gene_type:complete
MSHTKHVFVANVDGVKNAVADNQISIFENDGFQADGGAALVAGDEFMVVEGRYQTPLFKQSDIISVSAAAADVDGTQQVTFITLDDGANNDEAYEVKIIDVSEGREKFAIATFEVAAGTALATAEAAMVTAINGSKRDVFKDVVATADDGTNSGSHVSGVIKITSPVNKNLRFACNDASAVNATGTAVALVPSVGSKADIDAEFEDGLPFLGVTNIAGPNVVKPTSGADSGGYHRVCIALKTDNVAHGRVDMHDIIIYCDDTGSDAIIGHLNTVFGTNAPGTISIS